MLCVSTEKYPTGVSTLQFSLIPRNYYIHIFTHTQTSYNRTPLTIQIFASYKPRRCRTCGLRQRQMSAIMPLLRTSSFSPCRVPSKSGICLVVCVHRTIRLPHDATLRAYIHIIHNPIVFSFLVTSRFRGGLAMRWASLIPRKYIPSVDILLVLARPQGSLADLSDK